jgi:hypothetical protein
MGSRKVLIHQFNPEIYPYKVWVAITNDIEELSRNFANDRDEEIAWGNIKVKSASTISVHKKDDVGYYGVLIVFYKRDSCIAKYISHESVHAADFLWEYLGENNIGNEANAYLVGWIADCIERVKLNKE